jgi:hypothetical protein
MALREKRLNPFFRSVAAATLCVWLAALVLCTAHCDFGVCHGDEEHPACHGLEPSQSHHDDGDSPAPAHDDSSTSASCLTLKFALVSDAVPTVVPSELHVLYTLAPLVFDVTAAESASLHSRQTKPRDWVFTPEVCLGPALRGHAPPFSSFA